MLTEEQRPFPFAPSKQSQREKHFQRHKKVLGQFFTPAPLAAWMVEVVATLLPNHNAALDPACGDGAFFAAASAKELQRSLGH